MVVSVAEYQVTWEKLPDDFILPDDPVDNVNQPALAAALTESLELDDRLPATALATTNYGICATVNGKLVIKAPDWCFVTKISVSRDEVIRSYTPQLQGNIPAVVMEFLSDTEGGEYSIKATYPPGKYFFYERILRVPNYVIFDIGKGTLEVYRQDELGQYILQSANAEQRYWIPEMNLFLGTWQGTRETRTGPWLRWWNASGDLLLWGTERVEQERQRVEQERQRADHEHQRAEEAQQRAEQLIAQLRAAGIEPQG
jgi:Uma2 family endonuclease